MDNKKWGATERLFKIAGAKPNASFQYICELIEQLFHHFEMYYRDVKNSVMEIKPLKLRVTELENQVISLSKQIEAMQYSQNRHANMLNKLPVYGDNE